MKEREKAYIKKRWSCKFWVGTLTINETGKYLGLHMPAAGEKNYEMLQNCPFGSNIVKVPWVSRKYPL